MDKYTKFILTMIAVGTLGLNYHLFKGEIISPTHAVESHDHGALDIWDFRHAVERVVEDCYVVQGRRQVQC